MSLTMKINRFIMKYSNTYMWIAGVLTVTGIVLHHFTGMPELAPTLFIAGTAFAGFPIAFRAYNGVKYKTIGIELLVTIAVVGAMCIGEFSEGAIVTFLFQFGSFLEQKTMKKTRSAIKALTELAPVTAWKIEDEQVEEIDVDEVEAGDHLLVKTGGQIPVDGTVLSGEGYVNEASITGESVPAKKTQGVFVYGGTILESGTIKMEATRVGEDTTFARIIALVEEAQDAKSPIERFIDKFARYYTPFVVVMAVVVFAIFRNLDTAITVLVLACPGALVIGAPIANVAGIGRGAREGVLLKGGDSVHTFVKTDTVVFDKTGTLTMGYPEVVSTYAEQGTEVETALRLTALIEKTSNHPLAQAVVRFVGETGASLDFDSEEEKGKGLNAQLEGHKISVGNLRMMEEHGAGISAAMKEKIEDSRKSGASLVLTSIDGQVIHLIAIKDAIKADAKASLSQLKKMGIRKLVMLTGDHKDAAGQVAEEIGIDKVYAELLPENKLEILQELQKEGATVTFVGDGINDSPALTAADTGIAMGSGTDVAIESSDVVLIRSDLDSMVTALGLSRKTVRILYQNIAIAIGTVILLLAGLFAGYIHMAVGMLVHEASIMAVILNAMRLAITKIK